MKNTIKLFVAAFAIAAVACTSSSDKSSTENKKPRDTTQIQTPPDSSEVHEHSNDSSSITK